MKTVRFDTPWYRNGEVAYPAGVDLPADGFAEQLIEDGVAGSVTDSSAPQPPSDTTTPAA